MSTPPKVSRLEVVEAVRRIASRRAQVDDRSRDRLPDAPDSAPLEVLDYLVRYSGNNIPMWVRRADALDALVLTTFVWWEQRRLELRFLEAGKASGEYLAVLGGKLGVGRQGAQDRIDRSTALLRYADVGPDEKFIRKERRAQRADQVVPVSLSPEELWIAARRDELVAVISGLDEEADHHGLDGDEQRGWLDELVLDVGEEHLTPRTMTMLGLAVDELRVAEPILALPSVRHRHRIHDLLRDADVLRSDFAGLGTRSD
ncbi:hypothetical protein ACIA49_39095 [Kribbella sp. NPDC051587]|uniref:hypothetical protein n=1 Tax=Kribbella sp. NPDC051587 TaxID=3364119 RepID=UPI0037917943